MTQELAQALMGQSLGPRGSQGPQPGGGWEGLAKSISDLLMMPQEDRDTLAQNEAVTTDLFKMALADPGNMAKMGEAVKYGGEDTTRILGPMMEMGGIFAGRMARTADKRALGKAMTMEGRGKTRDEIWNDTGWFKDVDGKWKYEIDDSTMALTNPSPVAQPGRGVAGPGSAIQHPELAQAYPEMASMEHLLTGKEGGGTFQAPARYGGIHKTPARLTAQRHMPDARRSTALHEMQHATQRQEGFAAGGNPEEFIGQKQEVDRLITGANEKLLDLSRGMDAARTYGDDATVAGLKKEYDYIMDYKLNELVPLSQRGPQEQYRRLAGEAEARNVQSRRDFTPEQRQAQPPWQTQDVPEEEMIVRMLAGGA